MADKDYSATPLITKLGAKAGVEAPLFVYRREDRPR
jgi:hypothetical protein